MPLQHNSSEAAFKSNVEAERNARKSIDQALAIAYQIKRNDDIAKVKHLVGKIARGDCADSVRNDADKWITVHPHGGTGTPALIGEDGTVKGGMGGKFNGKNIKDAHGTERFTSGETNAETDARNKPNAENKVAQPIDNGAKQPHNTPLDNKTSEGSKMENGKISYTVPEDSPVKELRGVTVKNGTFKASSGKYNDPIDMVQFDLVLKVDGKDRHIGAMIKGKPELEKIFSDYNAKIAAEKKTLEDIGWSQYEAVQRRAINAQGAYEAASEHGYPVKQAAAMREADEALEAARAQYPLAAAYAKAVSYSFAHNDLESSAGTRAMKAIKNGADPLKTIEEMESSWSESASRAVNNS